MDNFSRPTLGLALSGGGNRSSFYIGFLEVLDEHKIKVDYIAACSGGSLVAAAYACGTLPQFKKLVLGLTKEDLKSYFTKGSNGGGLYCLDLFEETMEGFTNGLKFEDVRPLMGFVSVDIETGEKIILSMGSIARAARISCTLPGIFEPVKWGGKTLVDGGLLSMVPGDVVRQANMEVSVGVNMRGTKHIFTDNQIKAKRIFNFLKKILLVDEIEDILEYLIKPEDSELWQNPKIFSVLGKSLDLAILANKNLTGSEEACDLLITPNMSKIGHKKFCPEMMREYYNLGRATAEEYLPQIYKLAQDRQNEKLVS